MSQKWALLLVGLVLAGVCGSASAAGQCVTQDQVDHEFGDINGEGPDGGFGTTDPGACCDACKAQLDPPCLAWTLAYGKTRCFLKHTITAESRPVTPAVIFGVPICTSGGYTVVEVPRIASDSEDACNAYGLTLAKVEPKSRKAINAAISGCLGSGKTVYVNSAPGFTSTKNRDGCTTWNSAGNGAAVGAQTHRDPKYAAVCNQKLPVLCVGTSAYAR